MKNPFKIIHKFKNNNGRIQYMIYIFIGPLTSDEIVNIFKNITNKDFYTTITTLSKVNVLPSPEITADCSLRTTYL